MEDKAYIVTKPQGAVVFFDYFDAKYLINLPERKDRLKSIQKQFEKSRLPFGDIVLFEAVTCQERGGFESLGARGCFLSHLGVLKDAKAKGAEKVLIMEDDLGLCRDLFTYQERLVQELKIKKWDLAYFGNPIPEGQNISEPAEIMRVLPMPVRLRGSHFYAVRGKILPWLIVSLEAMLYRPNGSPEGGPMHLDGALGWFRRHNDDVVALVSRSVLGVQRSTKSDVHKGKLDAIALFSYFLRPVRKLKNIIKHGF